MLASAAPTMLVRYTNQDKGYTELNDSNFSCIGVLQLIQLCIIAYRGVCKKCLNCVALQASSRNNIFVGRLPRNNVHSYFTKCGLVKRAVIRI